MTLLDRTLSTAWNMGGQAVRLGMRAASSTIGRAAGVRGGGPKPDIDDVTLARKVETELFREPEAPKGDIDVNAADGVIELRGVVRNAALKKALEARVRAIPEVRDVHNLLHLPKTTAPTRADAPGRAKRRTTESKAKTPRPAGRRITGERKTPAAEPSPVELAAARQGRPPAPLGSDDETTVSGDELAG